MQNGSEGRAHPGLVCEEKWPANDSQRQTNEEREETFAGSIKDSMGRRKMKKIPSLSGVSVRGFYGFRHGEDGTSCGFATWRLSGAGGEIVDLKAADFQR